MKQTTTAGIMLNIEPGVRIEAVNPSWDRKFHVEERVENGENIYFLCRFETPDPCRNPAFADFRFDRFIAAHNKASGITVASNLTERASEPEKKVNLIDRGYHLLLPHQCSSCKMFVNFNKRSKRINEECYKITYTCPNCGHQDVDWAD